MLDMEGFKNTTGIWNVFISRKSIPAHRFSYLHHKGEIPSGYIVHQICGQNSCVNPEHLIVCTKSESRLDYNSTRVHPDAKKLLQDIRHDKEEPDADFGFGTDV